MNKKFFIMAIAAVLAIFISCNKEEKTPEQPTPQITAISPASGLAGIAATITGKNFSVEKDGNVVLFGEAVATVTSASATSLVVIVPENEPGKVSVTVAVGEKVSTGFDFTYEVPVYPAELHSLNPAKAQMGAEITLVGKHFGDDASVYTVLFDEDVAEIKSITDEAIVVVVPETLDEQANVILKKGDEMIPTVQQFTYEFPKTLAMGAITGIIYEAGTDFTVPVENLAEADEVKAVLVGKDGEVEVECLAEDGVLIVYVPAKLKGDYKLKVYVKGCLPVESAAEFAVYYVPQYQLDLTDPAGYIGGYGSGSHKDGVGSEARFNSTSGVALAPNGMLYVTTIGGTISSNNGHAIRVVDPATKAVTTLIEPSVLTLEAKQNIYPYHGAFASNGDYYVACKNGKFMIGKVAKADNSWSVFECTNTPAKKYDAKGINFMNVLLDAQDNIYVSDRDQARILKVNKGSTDVAKTIQVTAKINGEDNNIQINHIAWGKNKEQFIVSGSDDLVLVLADMDGKGTVIAGNGVKPHNKDNGTDFNFTDGDAGNPLSATIGQIGGIYYDEADGYIYFNDINSKAFRVLVPGVGGDYTKGVVKTLLGHPGLTVSAQGGLSNLGGVARMADGSFYIAANKAISKATPKAE